MRLRSLLAYSATAFLAACSNDNLLPVAGSDNTVTPVTLGALSRTPVQTASAFSVLAAGPLRTDGGLGSAFDFLYDEDPVRGPAFYPAEVVKVVPPSSTNPALKRMAVPFDSIKTADLNGYTNDSLMTVDSGDVFLVRSGIVCSSGIPEYGKIEVTKVDTVAHEVTFNVLVDNNCGYRGLEPGFPKH